MVCLAHSHGQRQDYGLDELCVSALVTHCVALPSSVATRARLMIELTLRSTEKT